MLKTDHIFKCPNLSTQDLKMAQELVRFNLKIFQKSWRKFFSFKKTQKNLGFQIRSIVSDVINLAKKSELACGGLTFSVQEVESCF